MTMVRGISLFRAGAQEGLEVVPASPPRGRLRCGRALVL